MSGRSILAAGIMTAAAAMGLALGSPQAEAQTNVNIDISIRLSSQFAYFPLPAAALVITGAKKHYGREWTEYRVGMPVAVATGFYNRHMPGQGWKLKRHEGNNWIWCRGPRMLTVMFVAVNPYTTLIAVREAPAVVTPLKKHGYGKPKKGKG